MHLQGFEICLQAFGPDLALTDMVLVGAGALADKLGIPKATMYIPGLLAPIAGHSYGSGASLRATVPQWMTLLPRSMVSKEVPACKSPGQAQHHCLASQP